VKKLGILATHPIQYHAPLFRELTKYDDIELKVYFCHQPTTEEQGKGFGISFAWDVDLTSGFEYIFLENRSKNKAQGFWGYDTPEIKRIIAEEQFDLFIVHGWAWKSCWQAFFACWKTKTKLAVRSDSQLPQGLSLGLSNWIKNSFKQVLYPLFIKHFDLCIPYGKRSAEYFEYYGGRNIVIAPHFVDNSFFAEQSRAYRLQKYELRSLWNIPDDAYCFIFCGKFQLKKRPMDILEALMLQITSSSEVPSVSLNQESSITSQQLRIGDLKPATGKPQSYSVHLLMVGDGELKSACEQYVMKHQLPVTFTGFLNQREISKAYAVSDCMILASDFTETWGLVVNEAMACGLPAIVSMNCGCEPDLIKSGTGLSFKSGDTKELALRMNSMVSQNLSVYPQEDLAGFIHLGFTISNSAKIIHNLF
jgi:glycosyltransferase involved in cell wall biosynthesis